MDYGAEYYFLSETDYASFVEALNDVDYSLGDFNFKYNTKPGYTGWYAEKAEINDDEMEWLCEFPSFDLRVINLSVQAWFFNPSTP